MTGLVHYNVETQLGRNAKTLKTDWKAGSCQLALMMSHSVALKFGLWQGEPMGTVRIKRPSTEALKACHVAGDGQSGSPGKVLQAFGAGGRVCKEGAMLSESSKRAIASISRSS